MQEKSPVTDDQEDEGTFIANNFSYKECTTYVEKDGQQGSCHCGLPKAKHGIEALKAEAKKWSTQHIAIRKPTNICGTHTLETGHQIKFLRLADSDDPTKLLELMCKYWHMQDERALTLVLSLITDPSEGFPEDVEEGLTHSVLVNSCWIISAGYEAAAKLEEVGRKRLSSKHGNFDFCNVCIMPWRQDLLQLWQGQSPESKDMAAFKKYTHCLFVDNGQEKQSSVSATNEFRHRLEELIQTEAGLPVLRILIGGELKDLVPVLMGLKSGLPLLLCSGTDGLADIIAQALSYAAETPEFHDFTPAQQAHLKSLLKNQDPKQDETNVSWSYKLLLKVVKFASVISVFRCHSDGAFDEKIFESFAKSQDQRGLQALIRWAFIKDWQDPMDRLDNNIWMAFMCDVIQKPLCLCDFRENVDILQLCLEQGLGAGVSDKRHVADCKISSMLLNSVSVMLVPGMFVTFLTQLTDMKTWSVQMEEELEDVMAELRETEQHAKTAKSKASASFLEFLTLQGLFALKVKH